MKHRGMRGFSLVEALVSLTVVTFVMAGAATMLVHNSRANRSQQLAAAAQADARNCLGMIAQKLRSAGWDPRGIVFTPVTLDADPSDGEDRIEIRADLNDDGDLDDDYEQLVIRHIADRIEWQRAPGGDFEILAINITNDSDGDGTVEPLFDPDADPPTRIRLAITARSPVEDPRTKDHVRYTVRTDVVLRQAL